MDLNKVFSGIGKKMLNDFDEIHSQIKHRGERGIAREEGLKSFLETYFPKRYAISNGEIVDHSGHTSHQCDVIIYDPISCPLLLSTKDYRVFPCEPIFAVIEVKSILDTKELIDAANKIKAIKNLVRDNGYIVGVLFAYKSAFSINSMDKISEKLREINSTYSPHEYIDLVCVLDEGVILLADSVEGYSRIPSNLADRTMVIYSELDVSVMLWFFIHLLMFLDFQKSIPPFIMYYTYPLSIGLVRNEKPSI